MFLTVVAHLEMLIGLKDLSWQTEARGEVSVGGPDLRGGWLLIQTEQDVKLGGKAFQAAQL